jgi:hypothetical protein
MKRDLDEKIIEMAHNLEEGDASRKQLIEQTKEFKKNLTDEQRKLVAPIVKLFQNEVHIDIAARIKHENMASIKCFVGCGSGTSWKIL